MKREHLTMDDLDHIGIPDLEEKPDPILLDRYNAACNMLLSDNEVILSCGRSDCIFFSESMNASLFRKRRGVYL